MSPFVPIICPICSHKLTLSNAKGQFGEYLLICKGKEGCSFIAYNLNWEFTSLSFYHGSRLIGVYPERLTISEVISLPYDKLDLLNGESLQALIKALVVFS